MRMIDADELNKQFSTDEPYGAGEISIIIDNAPTVSCIPQGKWIEDLSNYDNHYPKHIQDIFRCSICGFRNNRQTNFCSECGADMRETESARPDTLSCFNCKYNGKRVTEAPCITCGEEFSNWKDRETNPES